MNILPKNLTQLLVLWVKNNNQYIENDISITVLSVVNDEIRFSYTTDNQHHYVSFDIVDHTELILWYINEQIGNRS